MKGKGERGMMDEEGGVGMLGDVEKNAAGVADDGMVEVVGEGMVRMGVGGGLVSCWLGDRGGVREYNVGLTSGV